MKAAGSLGLIIITLVPLHPLTTNPPTTPLPYPTQSPSTDQKHNSLYTKEDTNL